MQSILYPIRETSDAYMDDAWTMSEDFQSHLVHLRKFLTIIREAGLTLSLAKCKFAQTRIPFVGFIVGNGEFFSDPSKTSAVADMVPPCSDILVIKIILVIVIVSFLIIICYYLVLVISITLVIVLVSFFIGSF